MLPASIRRPISAPGRVFAICATLLTAGTLSSRASLPLGPDANLYATGTASFTATDNLFLTDTGAQSDGVFDLTPGLELDYGTHSLFKSTLAADEDFELYSKHTNLNSDLGGGSAKGSYNDTINNFNYNLSFQQAEQPTETIRLANPTVEDLIQRNVYDAEAGDEYTIDSKNSVSGSVDYQDTHFRTPGFADLQIVTIPVNYYYKLDPKLDFTGGFAFAGNTLGTGAGALGAVNSNDYFFNLGLRDRAFTPKLSGQVLVGYTIDDRARGGNYAEFGLSAHLSYAMTTRTSFTLIGLSNYGYNSFGANFRQQGVSLGVTSTVDEHWSLVGSLSYNHYAYIASSERDDYVQFSPGVNYNLTEQIVLGLKYSYFHDSSNVALQQFTQNEGTLTATLRY